MIRRLIAFPAGPTAVGGFGALIVAALWAADPGGVASLLRERAIDALLCASPRVAMDSRVTVVDIDSRSVARADGWPLPREDMARLAARILDGRPAALVFDVFFAGPDRHLLRARLEDAADPRLRAELAPILAAAPDPDHDLGETLERGPTILAALVGGAATPDAFNPVRVEGPAGADAARPIPGALAPHEPLAREAFALGISALFGEDGGMVRKAPLLLSTGGGRLVPGLALEATRVAENVAMLSVDAGGRLEIGARRLPLGEGGALRLRWSNPAQWGRRTLSAADLLEGRIAPERFAGRLVIVGASAPEAGALRPTAIGPLTPTAQIHAEAAEQILAGVTPLRPPRALAVEIGGGLLLSLIAAALAARVGPTAAFVAQSALCALWLAFAAALILRDLVVDPAGPPLIVLVSGNMAAAAAFARTRRTKAFISRKFEQYLSADVVREIIAHPERLRREGEMRVVTALFTDIENFTPMTQRLAPRDLIALLDVYLGGLERIVTDHGGMVDGVAGDAIHAFFNVPLERADHADAPIACAAAIVEFSEGFRREPRAAAAGFGRTRVGVETGPAIVGDVGGAHRLNYTAYGDAVIVAARLEQANKQFDSQICIGPGAAAAARKKLAPLGRLRLKGLSEETSIYTIESR